MNVAVSNETEGTYDIFYNRSSYKYQMLGNLSMHAWLSTHE